MTLKRFLTVLVMAVAVATFGYRVSCLDDADKNVIKSTGKIIGSKITDLFLKHYLPKDSFTVEIVNNLDNLEYLVNPVLLLNQGSTVNPPPLIIPPSEEEKPSSGKILTMVGRPSGILCYQERNLDSSSRAWYDEAPHWHCVLFDAGKKTFSLISSPVKPFFEDHLKSFSIKPQANANNFGQLLENYYGDIAQMTTSENPQLYFEVRHAIPKHLTYKREPISILVGSALLGSLGQLASVSFSYFTADTGTTLTIENLSTEGPDAIVLETPMWQHSGVLVQDIIPSQIGFSQSSKVTFVAPFAEDMSLKRSVVVLSFVVQGTYNRLVLSTWWPRKLVLSSNELNAYSLSMLRYKTEPSSKQIIADLAKIVEEVRNADSLQFPPHYVKVTNVQRYLYWKCPITISTGLRSEKVVRFVNILTSMGSGRTNGMNVKIFGTSPLPNTNPSSDIVGPLEYTGEPDQTPPL